jgi:hypothetical protein
MFFIVDGCLPLFADMKMMFESRPPLQFVKHPPKRPNSGYTGISQFLSNFETVLPPAPTNFDPPLQKKTRQAEEVERLNKEKIELLAASWDPNSDPNVTS